MSDHERKLPDCMMPDGAEPCVGYRALLRERNEARAEVEFLHKRRGELVIERDRYKAALAEYPEGRDVFLGGALADLARVTAERDALTAAMPSEGADAAIGYARMKERAERAEAERLHTAICQAVTLMNVGDNRPAHNILREALIAHADAALGEKP